MAETAKKNPRIILRRTSQNAPEYRVMREIGLSGVTTDSVYSARKLDSHYLLESWYETAQLSATKSSVDILTTREDYRPLGIAHTNSEVDSRLVTLARDEFTKIRNRIEHPSPEQIAEDNRVRESFGLGTPSTFVFVDETA